MCAVIFGFLVVTLQLPTAGPLPERNLLLVVVSGHVYTGGSEPAVVSHTVEPIAKRGGRPSSTGHELVGWHTTGWPEIGARYVAAAEPDVDRPRLSGGAIRGHISLWERRKRVEDSVR
jgi:hypothetical protein